MLVVDVVVVDVEVVDTASQHARRHLLANTSHNSPATTWAHCADGKTFIAPTQGSSVELVVVDVVLVVVLSQPRHARWHVPNCSEVQAFC